MAAGTIPTGLYATQVPLIVGAYKLLANLAQENEGFENMGVISQRVEPWWDEKG